MTDFGVQLRRLRQAHGWRQVDLVEALGHQLARSTLANIETGRERPSARLWEIICARLPDWSDELAASYETSRSANGVRAVPLADREDDQTLGGPFVIEQLQLTYVFRHSRAPEEILETRRVRALGSADRYGLKLTQTDSPEFELETEALWGGELVRAERHEAGGTTIVLSRFDFGRRLRRGQSHEFALRHWVARDPDPGTEVLFSTTLPTERVAIHLNFLGPSRPVACWRFGPLPDAALVPKEATARSAVALTPSGTVSAYFAKPARGSTYGVGWDWGDE